MTHLRRGTTRIYSLGRNFSAAATKKINAFLSEKIAKKVKL